MALDKFCAIPGRGPYGSLPSHATRSGISSVNQRFRPFRGSQKSMRAPI